MRLKKYLNEQLKFRDESTGHYSGQTDMRLTAFDKGSKKGHIDYTVYGNEVSIKYIEVFEKRKGYGTKLILQLQKIYPKTEINWGMLTGDGSKLFKALKSKLYVDKGRIKKIKALQKEYKKLKDIENKAIKTNNWDDWDNDIYDRQYEIEEELYELGEPIK